MELRHKTDMERVLYNLFAVRSFDEREVLLFGHCNATEEMADWLLIHGITPATILDNNAAKQGQSYREIPITPPHIIQAYNADNSIVLIATRFFAEMSAQLRHLGYNGEIVQVVDYNSFAEYSLSDNTLNSKAARMLRGAETLQKIRCQYPAHHLIICPNNALGDVYWAMSFLPTYCAKLGISEIAVIVIGGSCRQVAEMFVADQILTLDPIEMDEYVQAVIYTRESNCIIAHHDRPYTDNIIRYLDTHFLSFIDYYRCAVYGLPKDTLPSWPAHNEAFSGMDKLVKGKTAIFAPYAKSIVRPPDLFWEKLTGTYRENGYTVLTSMHGGETPIKGTAPLMLPLNQMVSAVEYAGHFIGIRSGLCDIVNTARCRKTVIFPDCMYSTTGIKVDAFFDMPGWEKIVWRL